MTERERDQGSNDKPREPDHGWYVEFSRGWWRRCLGPNKDQKESSKSSGMYHGSVTDEQARELEKIVSDYLTKGDQPPRLTAYGMRDFIARAIGYWKSEPGLKAKEEVAELTAMIERPTARSAGTASVDLTKLDVMKLYDEAFESTFPTLHGEPPTVPVLQVMALREFARRLVGTPQSASEASPTQNGDSK